MPTAVPVEQDKNGDMPDKKDDRQDKDEKTVDQLLAEMALKKRGRKAAEMPSAIPSEQQQEEQSRTPPSLI